MHPRLIYKIVNLVLNNQKIKKWAFIKIEFFNDSNSSLFYQRSASITFMAGIRYNLYEKSNDIHISTTNPVLYTVKGTGFVVLIWISLLFFWYRFWENPVSDTMQVWKFEKLRFLIRYYFFLRKKYRVP